MASAPAHPQPRPLPLLQSPTDAAGLSAAAAPLLRLAGITKRFGTLVANDAISLTLRRGEVLALLGENGAGKSTLMSILFGHYTADAGHIEVEGRPLEPGQPKAALAAGIGMVHQHSTLADNLTVLDNVMLGTEPLWQPFTRRRAARERLQAVARRFGLAVDPDARVAALGVGERQRVEILKALVRNARILILDEPTAVLTPQEGEALFATLGRMVEQGLAVIFISHKLAEVLRVSHRVAVLRAGRLVAQADAGTVDAATLAQWMVGQSVAAPQRRPATRPPGAPPAPVVAELQQVSTGGSDRERLHGVSLALRSGEIVAVAGVSGNGQTALAELLCGTRTASAGHLTLAEVRVSAVGGAAAGAPAAFTATDDSRRNWTPARLLRQGVARIPEDRRGIGVVGDLPVWENAVAERLGEACFSRWGWVRRRAARAHAARLLAEFDVRGGGLDVPARALSGGNMQKLILGRALRAPDGAAPRLIVAHQPTWGLDVGAVAAIQAQLIAARDAGAAVLLISDDLDEVLMLGDRIAVMHGGHLTEARAADRWTRDSIGLAMAGHEHGADAGRSAAAPGGRP